MNFELQALPYAGDALEPVISARTVSHHYEKHHAGYLSKLEAALEGAERDKSLEQLVLDSHGANGKVFNLAAQVWNHDFYWQSLTPQSGTAPSAALAAKIDAAFGSLDALKTELHAAAMGQFGSGWAWLALGEDSSTLEIVATGNAENPLTAGKRPLLTLDVWEHAYYLDYQQARDRYLTECIDKLLNWEFASSQLEAA